MLEEPKQYAIDGTLYWTRKEYWEPPGSLWRRQVLKTRRGIYLPIVES